MTKPDNYIFYVDDSGTRHPDKKDNHGSAREWFALGGVIVKESLVDEVKAEVSKFKEKWDISYPLHSQEIRSKSRNFHWLRALENSSSFYDELTSLLIELPVVGHACVIDRPGYNKRYAETYGRDRWQLCKTAFSIAVERAAKFVESKNGRLRVYVEQSSKKDEKLLKSYYEDLRSVGCPFNANNSAVYSPVSAESLKSTLFEFKVRPKASTLMQIADLYLHPICVGGYDQGHRPYQELVKNEKLLDAHVKDVGAEGIKYSCFDGRYTKTQSAFASGSLAATPG